MDRWSFSTWQFVLHEYHELYLWRKTVMWRNFSFLYIMWTIYGVLSKFMPFLFQIYVEKNLCGDMTNMRSNHHHHRHHYNLHWQVRTGRRCSSSSDSGRTRRGRSLSWLSAEPGRKNKKIIIKDKKLTLNNCWTMDKHLHDYHILGGVKRFCCQRAVGALTKIFWHQTMTLNCLTL